MQRVAFKKPLDKKPQALNQPVPVYCFNAITGAGWIKSAGMRQER